MSLRMLVTLLLALCAGSLVAQSTVAEQSTKTVQVTAQATPGRIALSLESASLSDALWMIARRSGVNVIFDGSMLPTKKVNYRAENVTMDAAFAAVLKGTGLKVAYDGNGRLVLMDSKSGSAVRGQGTIVGKITDAKSGKGVSGATVSVGNGIAGSKTGEDGSYSIAGIAIGTHTVTVRLVGYTKQTRSISVGEGVTIAVDFKLEPSTNVLDQVVVTGTVAQTELKAVPNAITVVTAKQIEERGITKIDQLFRGEIPGLFAVNLGSNANAQLDGVLMFSRGATALTDAANGGSSGTSEGTNPIKTYIDGVELYDPSYLSQIDPGSIDRIEILTGPQASTIYGSNALNGVMQIFTKRGNTPRPQLTFGHTGGVTQNSFNRSLAPTHVTDGRISGVEARWSYNIGGSWDYTGSWTPAKHTERMSGDGGGRFIAQKFTMDASIRRASTRNKSAGNSNQVEGYHRTTGLWSPSAGLLVNDIQRLSGQTTGITLSHRPVAWWFHEIGWGADISVTARQRNTPTYGTSGGDTLLFLEQSTNSRTSERYTTNIQIPVTPVASLNLTLGGDHWSTQSLSSTAFPVGLTGTLAGAKITRAKPAKNTGAFVQGQFSLNNALFFTYGIRSEWNPNYGDDVRVSPGRYGASYVREIGFLSAKFRGSYGRSTRPPAGGFKLARAETISFFLDLFGPYDSYIANTDLNPEHQQGGEGGVELYVGNRASLVVTRYNQTVDNLISVVSGVDSIRSIIPDVPGGSGGCSSQYRDEDRHCYRYQFQYLNVGSIRNQGWELQSSVNTGPITTRGTYSWTKSRVLGVTPRYRALLTDSKFTPGRPFDYLPEHTWALGLTYARNSTTVGLMVNGIGMLYKHWDDARISASAGNRLFTSRSRINAPNIYRSMGAGYSIADLNATHRFGSHIDAVLQIHNLNNYSQNDFSGLYAAIGRQSKLGLRVRFQ